MPLSTDVRLPRPAVPVFPDACCVCCREKPGDVVAYKGRRFRWAELLLPWLWFFGKRVRLDVPVCSGCRPQVLSGRFWRTVVLLVALGVGIWFTFPWVKSFGFGRSATKWLSIGLLFVEMVPVLLWWVLRPPPFDLTVEAEHVDYEFASADYAERFADANPGSRLVG